VVFVPYVVPKVLLIYTVLILENILKIVVPITVKIQNHVIKYDGRLTGNNR
jgi:hypothetical protein